MGRFLIDLRARYVADHGKVGGKGAGLSRLIRHGFPVPSTFIIPIRAFHSLQSQLFRQLRTSPADVKPEHLAEMRQRILSTPLPHPIQLAISKALARLGNRVAVRSSMAGEDSRSASFAGLLDTYLNLGDAQAVMIAVKKCLASSFNWRLWKYQKMQRQSPRHIRKTLSMAVILQDMVDAKVSGLAFSSDPNSGISNVIIEAVHGSGESLVQGHSVPFRYIIDDKGHLNQTPFRSDSDYPFSQREVLALAASVRKIATLCSRPQDIEWVWDGNDFYFLQCRPITALPDQHIYSARLVADMSPGLVKPLLWSTKSRSMVRNVFGRICKELVGPHQIDFATYIKRIHSRTYADMTAFGDFLVKLGLPRNFFEMIVRHEKVNWRLPYLQPKKFPVLCRMIRFASRHFRAKKEITSFIQSHSLLLEPMRHREWAALSPDLLIDIFDHLMELHAQTQWYIFIGPLNMTLRYRLLSRLLRSISETINTGELLKGVEGLQALEPNSHIMRMSVLAKEMDKHGLDLMLEGESQKLGEHLSLSEKGQELQQHFQEFLTQFGFLSANGSDFSAIPWNENPSQVWKSIGRMALQTPLPDTNRKHEIREREVLRIRKQLKRVNRFFFDRLVHSTVQYMKLRESTSLLMSEETYLMRCALINIGIQLKNEKRLKGSSDIFYLYYDELRLFLQKDLPDTDVERLIETRKSEMAQDAALDPPDIIMSDKLTPLPETAHDDHDYLEGIPGSPGWAKGKAQIVMDPSALSAELNAGDILVVPFTDVGWTPLLPGIGGIIAETGGQLSHTSIIAREYGMPSVVSVRDATRRIKDGQSITIDGDRGRVYLKHL